MAAQAQWWQRIGNAAQIASAVIALFGFAVIIFQVNELRSNNRASGARQVYLAYSDLSFRHPQFSAPDYAVLKAGDRLVFEQYKLFVSYLLYACGAVLPAFAREPEWRKSCEYEVKDHLPFLCEVQTGDPAFLETFGKDTIGFVRAEMARAGVAAPDCKLRKS